MNGRISHKILAGFALLLTVISGAVIAHAAGDYEKPRKIKYDYTPPAPRVQTQAEMDAKSAGCVTCHTNSDAKTMHMTPAVKLGCTDCHGGDANVNVSLLLNEDSPDYITARNKAHVLPKYPDTWHWPKTANPKRSYTLLNKEAPEYIRFVNPSDYRVAREACGSCHLEQIVQAERSLMATGSMLWAGASYNNGILPHKVFGKLQDGTSYALGEAYTKDGKPAILTSPGAEDGLTDEQIAAGVLARVVPLPEWNVIPPADVFRVFERGGRNIATQFPEIGLPNAAGQIQRIEEPGRPDIRQSNRGPGTGSRVAIPVLNIHKTRLNDPFTWFMGTNDQPGDYRTSGCGSCHVVYANDRQPRHSSIYAKYGRDGKSFSKDPTIPKDEKGHPIEHAFTRAIPTSQCMNCHMHQPNIFLNSFLGYTMWDYESDAPIMWPEEQKYPTMEEQHKILERNPEGAAVRGKWGDAEFSREVFELNDDLNDTQFADYHGHGWNFRAVFKRDRKGNLLDKDGNIVANDDPEKFRKKGEGKFAAIGTNPGKSVHMMSIHAEKGMQCVDCHYAQDGHGNGFIHGEVASAVEISCKDCHGTAKKMPSLYTSGPASRPGGMDMTGLRNPDGKRRFEWIKKDGNDVLLQRSVLDPELVWEVSLTKDSVTAGHPKYNEKSAWAKTVAKDNKSWGADVQNADLAHDDEEMECFTCHLSWTTSCGGCHLPIEANWKKKSHKYDGGTTRNYATYNPQVARDQMFQLGKHQSSKNNTIAPIRSTSALVLSSTNINRERIYVQQPPVSSVGFSSQAFAPHFPHTVRKEETKTCSDCHLSVADDNNAIMAQLLLLGTNFVNFVGMHAYVGLDAGLEAVRVTEWDEPQAVFGSYLQKYAYPDYFKAHVVQNGRELIDWQRGRIFDTENDWSGETGAVEEIANVHQKTGGEVRCLQLRGEYLYVAEGKGGFRVYDVANIANKGISERIVTAPFSALGHDTHVESENATCMALATNQPINPLKNTPQMQKDNQEQPFHPIYNYAVITDSVEGLILVDVNTLGDGEPRNNFLDRAVTWNDGGVLTGARHVTLAGHHAYITTDAGLAVIDLNNPLTPRHIKTVLMNDARQSDIQFRYLWVTDADGLKLLDVTDLANPIPIPEATVPMTDAQGLYLARTYAYVAGGAEGMVIVDIETPKSPKIYSRETFDGKMNDVQDIIIGSTNASLFAYIADGRNGMKVVQLTSPDSQPNFYGFSPEPKPELIAYRKTKSAALGLSKGIDRDRAVDEGGHQMAVFGRLGSRPFTRDEMENMFIGPDGKPYYVSDAPPSHSDDYTPSRPTTAMRPK